MANVRPKVALVFPPQLLPLQPYLANPSLCGMLRSKGFEAAQLDLNVEAFDWLLRPDRVAESLSALIGANGNGTCVRNAVPDLRRGGVSQLHHVAPLVFLGADVPDQLSKAKRLLRSPNVFDDFDGNYVWAQRVINTALQILSRAHGAGYDISLTSYKTPFNNESSHAVWEAVENAEQDVFYEFFVQRVLRRIVEERPRVVGVSFAFMDQIIPGLILCKLLKEHTGAHIVVGGQVITRLADVLSRKPHFFDLFDSMLVYEGDFPFIELVSCLENDGSLDRVPSLIYRDSSGCIRINQPYVPQPDDICRIPAPDFDDLPFDLYLSPQRIIPYLTSRRCYFGRCTFCSIPNAFSPGHRQRSADQIVYDLAFLSERHGAQYFQFMDDALSPHALHGVVPKLIEDDHDIRWSGFVRLENEFAAPGFCERLAESGCRLMHWGLESASPRTLERMDKKVRLDRVPQILEAAAEAGITNHLFLLIGFPGDTEEDIQMTIDFVQRHADVIHSLEINSYRLAKHSPVWENPAAFGVTPLSANGDGDFALDLDFTVPRGLTREVVTEMERRFWMIAEESVPTLSRAKHLMGAHLLIHADRREALPVSLSI